MACGHQFRAQRGIDTAELWNTYVDGKQTIAELSFKYSVSQSTIKRVLRKISLNWSQPPLEGSGFVHLDATYWGRNSGIMLALDNATGKPLYLSFINHEKTSDYRDAISSIEQRGYVVRGIVIDGRKSLFEAFSKYHVQMCQFHMIQIVRRYLTRNPKMLAARELKDLAQRLTTMSKDEFETAYVSWKTTWEATLNRRSTLKSGKTQYTHKRLRTAMHSIDFYLPYLFTYQKEECKGMPNTNNKIEGTFTDLKKNLNNHSGMSEKNRKRFVSGFFLALEEKLNSEKQETLN